MAGPGYSLPILVTITLYFFSNLCNCADHHHVDNGGVNFSNHDNVIDMKEEENPGQADFRIDLVRRDSAQSPEITKSERLRRAIERSHSRLDFFLSKTSNSSLKDISSPVHAGSGEFLMEISIGTPPLKYNAILDTGSDLIWTQCEPCTDCYDQSGKIFNPSKSKSYSTVPCSSSFCRALPSSSCGPNCQYDYEYGDYSFTMGDLAFETFHLATTTRTISSIAHVAFGCGHDNEGPGFTQGSGLVGMGRGTLSLISQLGSKVNKKFSYCLVSINDPDSETSPLLFGKAADLRGSGVKSTPLIRNRAEPSFYYLNLQGVSVGKSRLNIPANTFKIKSDGSGGFIIDSGTTITYLEEAGYDMLKSAVQSSMTLPQVDGSKIGLDLCYALPSDSSRVRVPAITFHFAGADYTLPAANAFMEDSESGVLCLAMGSMSGLSILGNIQQQNFHILYDLGMNRLSFVPTACDSL